MSKLRSVNTQFWSDPWVEDLNPSEKLLYLYFITNEKTNMLGVYELSLKKISFETGIDKKTIEKALKGFETIGKVKYLKNHVILLNFAKHQNYNTNMKKSAIEVYNNLPNSLKTNDEIIDKSNPLKGFERVLNHLGMVRKIEVEVEVEIENEIENEKEINYLGFSEKFKNAWDDWLQHKKEIKSSYKSIKTQNIAIAHICENCEGFENRMIEAIYHSIANNYRGIYEPNNKKNESKEIRNPFT